MAKGVRIITFGSLFSGAGGLDYGLELAGMKCVFQVENDKHCLTILNKYWPNVSKNQIRPCMGLVGGDPCPIRSRASKIHGTGQSDMSGYFLAMVARCRPEWVLRENVPAPDVVDFITALEVLGYHCLVAEANSAAFTGQNRCREFVVGFDKQQALDRFRNACLVTESNSRDSSAIKQKKSPLASIGTRRYRMDPSDTYVYEGPERGLRILSFAERESLQGWPIGWTCGVPNTARERMLGNGVTAPVATWLGLRIIEAIQADIQR